MKASELRERLAHAQRLQREHHLPTADALTAAWSGTPPKQAPVTKSARTTTEVEPLDGVPDRLTTLYRSASATPASNR